MELHCTSKLLNNLFKINRIHLVDSWWSWWRRCYWFLHRLHWKLTIRMECRTKTQGTFAFLFFFLVRINLIWTRKIRRRRRLRWIGIRVHSCYLIYKIWTIEKLKQNLQKIRWKCYQLWCYSKLYTSSQEAMFKANGKEKETLRLEWASSKLYLSWSDGVLLHGVQVWPTSFLAIKKCLHYCWFDFLTLVLLNFLLLHVLYNNAVFITATGSYI